MDSYFPKSSLTTILKAEKPQELSSRAEFPFMPLRNHPELCRKTELQIITNDKNSQKWLLPLIEDVFLSFYSQAEETAQTVFGEGSLFSPFLFGKFFDPADAFPLWDFDSEALLPSKINLDWSETDDRYSLGAELPVEARNVEVAISGNKENLIEIRGIWKARNLAGRDWRIKRWWEHGFVRCLEAADDADCRHMEACIYNDTDLEIILPKKDSI